MKKYIVFIYIIFFSSCRTLFINEGYVMLYQGQRVGMFPPHYIVIFTQQNIFEYYDPFGHNKVIGNSVVKNDTLFLIPQKSMFFEDLYTCNVAHLDALTRIYLMNRKKGQLIDITDYKSYYKNYGIDDYDIEHKVIFTLLR